MLHFTFDVATRHGPCNAWWHMIFFLLAHVFSMVLDLIWVRRRAERDTDIEILLLRQHLHMLQRKQRQPPRISRWEKLTLIVLAGKLATMTNKARHQLAQVVFLFKPETLLWWHRNLVRRKWTFKQNAPRGRPAISSELEALLLRLANENPRWGYSKLQGEAGARWAKLGYDIACSTVRHIRKRHTVPPAPHRSQGGSNWRTFLRHYNAEVRACDFFTIDTISLKTFYVLFFIELGSRHIHLAGCTANPTSAWVTQQARQLRWKTQDGAMPVRFLIHDRDSKFPVAFDTVFTSAAVTIVRTPVQAPNAHAFAERWIRSVREECLDQILIVSEGHLRRVLTA